MEHLFFTCPFLLLLLALFFVLLYLFRSLNLNQLILSHRCITCCLLNNQTISRKPPSPFHQYGPTLSLKGISSFWILSFHVLPLIQATKIHYSKEIVNLTISFSFFFLIGNKSFIDSKSAMCLQLSIQLSQHLQFHLHIVNNGCPLDIKQQLL